MKTPNNILIDQTQTQAAPIDIPAKSSNPVAETTVTPPQFVTFSTALILCAISTAITLMLAFYAPAIAAKRGINLPGASSAGAKVVYLDFDEVLASGIKQAMNSSHVGLEEIQKDADKFQVDISSVVQRYVDSGYIVINKKALIKGPRDQEITGDVIRSLGIKQ